MPSVEPSASGLFHAPTRVVSVQSLRVFHEQLLALCVLPAPDNTMVMRIQDPNLSNKPDKLILIFDSTTLTCEFSAEGIIALHTTQQIRGSSIITSSFSCRFPGELEIVKERSFEVHDEDVVDQETKEESISLEDWMLRPDEWL